MMNLNDREALKALDTVNVLGSIEQLAGQSKQAWDEVNALQFPDTYTQASNIVFSGMGGSALGAYVVKSLFFDSLTVPFEIVNDYHLPKYVDSHSLIVLSSYSGTTEETLSCMSDATARKSLITGLTTGGTLADLFKQSNGITYIFTPAFNPSNQPRLGSGYSVVGLAALLHKLGFISIAQSDVDEIAVVLNKGNVLYGVSVPIDTNRAKQLAQSWIDKIPIIVAAEFLTHVGRVIRNQLHESAKCFSAYHDIPELNHHLMEGLSNPKSNKDTLRFLFLSSSHYSNKIQKRIRITRDVVGKQGISSEEFMPSATSRLAQVMECIQFGAYVNYYMAMLYELDPSKIPWVDYFKAELAKA